MPRVIRYSAKRVVLEEEPTPTPEPETPTEITITFTDSDGEESTSAERWLNWKTLEDITETTLSSGCKVCLLEDSGDWTTAFYEENATPGEDTPLLKVVYRGNNEPTAVELNGTDLVVDEPVVLTGDSTILAVVSS